MSRRALSWLPVLTTCCVLWTAGADPGESRVHAVESMAAEFERSAPAPTEREIPGPPTASERKAPDKAYALLEALKRRNGDTLPGYVGGKVFQNRERRLPRGRYKEYDVNRRVPGHSRDAERLVIEQDTGKAYYTNDHYRTLLPLN